MAFEYKLVGAPERCKRRRGCRTNSDRVAAAMEELLAQEARDGWEYQRTDLIPVEERTVWFGGRHEVHRAVLVFRRALPGEMSHPAAAFSAGREGPERELRREPLITSLDDSDAPDRDLAAALRATGPDDDAR